VPVKFSSTLPVLSWPYPGFSLFLLTDPTAASGICFICFVTNLLLKNHRRRLNSMPIADQQWALFQRFFPFSLSQPLSPSFRPALPSGRQ